MFEKKIKYLLKKHDYKYFHKKITKSTMNDAKNYVKNNKKNCIFLSDQQSAGKGQRGNIWHSPIGNIYCSVSFDNFLNIKDSFLFTILIATSIKMSLEKFNADNIFFKWPNDILYKQKKFAGIISEVININESKSYIVIGFGINVISAPIIKSYDVTFIKSFCRINSIDDFLLVFFDILFSNLIYLQNEENDYLRNFFSQSLILMNQKIKIVFPNLSTKSGIFKGINNDGSLILKTDNSIENIYYGSIKL